MKTRILLLLSLCAGLSGICALDYTKNVSNFTLFGTGAIGPLVSGASAVSMSAWINIDAAAAGANVDDIFCLWSSNTVAFNLNLSNGFFRGTARRQPGDTASNRQTAGAVGTAAWHHVGVVFNFNGTAPTIYLDGAVSAGAASGTLGSGVFTHFATGIVNQDALGCVTSGSAPSSTGRQFDGGIAEFAVWNVDIGAGNMAALGAGFRPDLVQKNGLVCYVPGKINRNDWRRGGALTLGGSIPQRTHPRVR